MMSYRRATLCRCTSMQGCTRGFRELARAGAGPNLFMVSARRALSHAALAGSGSRKEHPPLALRLPGASEGTLGGLVRLPHQDTLVLRADLSRDCSFQELLAGGPAPLTSMPLSSRRRPLSRVQSKPCSRHATLARHPLSHVMLVLQKCSRGGGWHCPGLGTL